MYKMTSKEAEEKYWKKFYKKTSYYTHIEMDLGVPEDKLSLRADIVMKADLKAKIAEIKPKKNLQKFIKFIFDKEMMEKSLISVGYDVKKLPPG